jgi:halocyanin-like protein
VGISVTNFYPRRLLPNAMSPTRPDAGVDRRTVLKAIPIVTAGALAGCAGSSAGGTEDGDGGEAGGEGGGSNGGGGDSTAPATTTETAASADAGGESTSFDGWFDGVGNYDGTVDATGESDVEITVGAQGNGGNLAFDPPAVRVSTGTTVVWTWTGAGGSHNVAATDGSFESELVAEEGHTFSQTFEEPGTVRYVCTPHETLGMKGAVVVE